MLANNQVFLKTFDVDDATPDSVDNDPSNKIDPNGKAGDDNMDTIWPRTGIFVSNNSSTTTVTLDSNGEANVLFQTTVQPGDNFRVALAVNQNDLNGLQVSSPSGSGFVDGDSDQQPTGFNGVVSPMLTVWRHLWCEFDSMTAPPQTAQAGAQINYDQGVVTQIVDNGNGTSTVTVYSNTNPSQVNPGDLTDYGPDRYENGPFYIDGVGTYTVNTNTHNQVVIQGTPGHAAVGATFQIYDDDVIAIGTRQPRTLPYQLSGGALIYTAFADAFIEPIKAPAQYIQTNIPFHRNISENYYFDWQPTVSAHRDLTTAADMWTAYCLCAWQGDTSADHDPDTEEFELGLTDFGFLPDNQSAIYIETIREAEENPNTPRINEQHTIVHEIGHQGGAQHSDKGIMTEGAPITENQFRPVTIKRFRQNQIYHP